MTDLANQGDPVPVGIKEGLVEKLTGSPSGKNSKGLKISQIQARTPQIVAKIIATGLTPTGRGSDLKLDMLEAVDTIVDTGKIYIGLSMSPTCSKGSMRSVRSRERL